MDEYSDFKKYFNKNFWKCFKDLSFAFDEISESEKEAILKELYSDIKN